METAANFGLNLIVCLGPGSNQGWPKGIWKWKKSWQRLVVWLN